MSNIFDKWTNQFGGSKAAQAVKEREAEKQDSGEYVEVPVGQYEVKIEKMGLKECKSAKNKGMPMFNVQFRILAGEFKNQCIFMNQLIVQDFQIHIVNEFLRSLESDMEIEFDGNYGNYENLILDVLEDTSAKFEYLLDYSENKNGFKQYEIAEIYDK